MRSNGEISGVQPGVVNQEGGEPRLSRVPRRKKQGPERKEGINYFKCHRGEASVASAAFIILATVGTSPGAISGTAGCGSHRLACKACSEGGERDGGHVDTGSGYGLSRGEHERKKREGDKVSRSAEPRA